MQKMPTVTIVGRINVGKSALFNCLTETGKAIVSDIPGTTRDYNIGQISWNKKTFKLIDTGGVNIDTLKNSIESLLLKPKKIAAKFKESDFIEQAIIKQTKRAVDQSDLILMVVDGKSGLLPQDKDLALVLKKLKRPVLLVANKIDNRKNAYQLNDFFKLGLGSPIPVSALNGSGTGDLLDEVTKKIKGRMGRPKTEVEMPTIKVALIGKPNVGKSSLVNKILGEERVIVSPIPRTTREPQNTELLYKDKLITLIDTAGLTKKGHLEVGIEKSSAERSESTIRKADVVLMITEANETITSQDRRLMSLIKSYLPAIVLVANKWDLVKDKTPTTDKEMGRYYQFTLPYLTWVPVIFVSGKTGQNVTKILDLVLQVYQEKQKVINQESLNKFLAKIVKTKLPAKASGPLHTKIYSIEQTRSNPPIFTITVGKDQTIHFSYLRFIENQLRYHFGFIGVPIKLVIERRKK